MKQTLTIGLDAKRIVRNGTGLGSYGRTLANGLADIGGLSLRLYAPDTGREELRRQVPERENLCYCYPTNLSPLTSLCPPLRKSLWRSRGITRQLSADGVQVFHGLSGELPAGLRQAGIKSVVTIHDLIFMRHPEYYHWMDTKIYEWKFRQTLREADRIVAISECTRRDICQLGGIDTAKVGLIYQSCAPRFQKEADERRVDSVAQRYRLPQRYVLSVGSVEERKNTLLALKALFWLPADIHLVLVGRRTAYTGTLTAYADRHGLRHRLHILHGVTDDDLPAVYARAEVFVYPSRYEGFGIPIIEAIGMGLPVVGCTGSCLEEAGGPDNLYVGPDDAEAMAHAIGCMLRGAEGREERIGRSRHYIERFANTGAAAKFAELYYSLIE